MISENEKLLIASKYKKTSKYILDMASNYPHKYLELKTRIINTTFDVLELIYYGNIDENKRILIIPKLKMIDYYLLLSFNYKIISERQYKDSTKFLLEEVKMITKSEERNRALITKLKIVYRELENKFERNKKEYGEVIIWL